MVEVLGEYSIDKGVKYEPCPNCGKKAKVEMIRIKFYMGNVRDEMITVTIWCSNCGYFARMEGRK